MYTKRDKKHLRKYTPEQIALIYSLLSYGDRKEIENRLGKHKNHIYKVFSRKGDGYYDEEVIDTALLLISERTEYQTAIGSMLEPALDTIKTIAEL